MYHQIWNFVCAVVDHWATLLTGGIVTAIVAFVERYNNKPINPKLMLRIFGVFLVWAFFLAWRDENIARLNAETQNFPPLLALKNNTIAICNQLTDWDKRWPKMGGSFAGVGFDEKFRSDIFSVVHQLNEHGFYSAQLNALINVPNFQNADSNWVYEIAAEFHKAADTVHW